MPSVRKALEPEADARPVDARRDRRERQLIDAALTCISSRGLTETTVQAVAAEAGMAVGSISQYFDSKAKLLTAVLIHLSDEFERASRAAVAAASPEPAARLAAFVGCYFSASLCQRRKTAVWFAFWGEVKARPQYRAVCAAHDRRHDETLEVLCAALLTEDAGHGQDARTVAKLIASVCHGLWLEQLTGLDDLTRQDLAAMASASLAALFPRHAAALRVLV